MSKIANDSPTGEKQKDNVSTYENNKAITKEARSRPYVDRHVGEHIGDDERVAAYGRTAAKRGFLRFGVSSAALLCSVLQCSHSMRQSGLRVLHMRQCHLPFVCTQALLSEMPIPFLPLLVLSLDRLLVLWNVLLDGFCWYQKPIPCRSFLHICTRLRLLFYAS